MLKGKSKVRRRNRDSQDILKELHLNLEDVGFEFPTSTTTASY